MKNNILTKEEKDYLEIVLKPFEINKIKSIIKYPTLRGNKAYILITCHDDDFLQSLNFPKDRYLLNLEFEEEYTLEDLGLFEERLEK